MKNKVTIVGIIIICFSILIISFLTVLLIKSLNKEVNIELNGNPTESITVGNNYEDKLFSIKERNKKVSLENVDYEINGRVDTNTIGKYYIDYSINYKDVLYILKRTVVVVDDIEPQISIDIDTIEKDYCKKTDTTKYTITALDNYDGDLTDKIIKEEKDDKYIFSVSDSSGNTIFKEVNIKYLNKPKDVFKLKGNSKVYVPLKSKYIDDGVTFTDGCGSKINKKIKTTGSVNTNLEGTYKLTFSTDSDTLTRTVIVYEPNVVENKVKDNEKVIYLTFDDGPGPYTTKILNTLDKYNVKVTFFVTHQYKDYVPLIEEEYKRGHVVGVHTYTHNYNVYRSIDTYLKDFNKMNDVIKKYTGSKSKIFRFPGGSSNTVSMNYAKGIMRAIASRMTKDGYVYFDWNVSSGDASFSNTQKSIYNRVIKGVKSCTKCVVLMHDINSKTAAAIDDILKTLTKQGYKFGTLSTSSPTVHHGFNN